jgi:hypothetical protein
LAHPESTLRTAAAAFPQYLPPMAKDLRSMVEAGFGKVGEVLALDRPMELRFYERMQKPGIVFTGSLRDSVDVRTTFKRFRLNETPDGRLEVLPPHPFSVELAMFKECEIDLSSQVRTVSCANHEGLLARTRSQRSSRPVASEEASLELGTDFVREQMLKDESPAAPGEERAGRAAGRAMGRALVKDWVEDLRSLELDASLTRDAVTTGLTLHWIAGRSLVARVLGSSSVASAPPARFFRLPIDSDIAFFSKGVEGSAWGPLKKAFMDGAMSGITSKTDYPDSIMKEGRQLLDQTFFTGGPWMFATGRRVADVREALKGPKAGSPAEERKVELARIAKQWMIFEVDEPGDEVVARAKALLDFSRRADLYGKAKQRPPGAAKSSASSDDQRRWKTDTVAAPRGLPAATFHVVNRSIRIDQPKNEKLVETTHLLVVPEGDHAWIGLCANEKTLVEHMKRVLEGQPASGTLAARKGIEPLSKAGPLAAGGMFSLGALLGLTDDFVEGDPDELKEKLDYMAAVPSKGTAPYIITVRRGNDDSPRITIEAKASTRSVDEMIGFLQRFESD